MENTSINKKPSYSTYSSVLRGDYLFTRKSKGCLKETFHPLRQTPQLGAILVVGITGCGVIVCDTHLECFFLCFFLSNVHVCICVCEPYLLFHAESLDVSGQFICDSDEQCGGDGLSVVWLTEQWWIIPATLSPPRHAANDFTGVL